MRSTDSPPDTVAYGNQPLPPVMSTAYPPCECARCGAGVAR
ncbi:hypothetical protein [Streptomyces sp. NPDC018693]